MSILARSLSPKPIDGSIAGGCDDPCRRTWRQAAGRPPLHGHRERVLDRFLGNVDVTKMSNQYRDRAAVFGAKDPVNFGAGDWGHG